MASHNPSKLRWYNVCRSFEFIVFNGERKGFMIPRVLTIAASDSSGAAGVQADLKTFEARQVYGMSALTAITAQDSTAVKAIHLLDADFVAQQITAVLADIGANAIKTGLLLRAEIINTVDATLHRLIPDLTNLIVDPVLVAGNGRRLVDDAAIEAYKASLFPHALIITPNLDEARILSEQPITTLEEIKTAARILHAMGPRYVLIKGGHLDEHTDAQMLDVLYDGNDFYEFRAERLPLYNARGTGCTLASCIAAEVAKGCTVPEAASTAKQYVTEALKAALDWKIGAGRATIFHSVGRAPLFTPESG
jgi:hydroxymethylpyrimidine/phosphomethylpyrimidine kinase